MLNVEHLQHQVDDLLLEVLAGNATRSLARELGLEGEIECLADCEGGVMVLVLFAVHCFSSVPLLEEVRIEGAVEHIAVDLGVAISLIADDFQKGGASTSRLAENEDHFPGLHHTFKVLQNIEFLALLALSNQASDGFKDVEERYEGIREGLSALSANDCTRRCWPVSLP
jgi:hypothetical protein